MTRPIPIIVRKRDGSHEPLQVAKLKRTLSLAMRECSYDVRYADPLARAVAMHLDGWDERRPPSTEYLFECVESVLRETGLDDVARQLDIHRRHRASRRRNLRVVELRRGTPVATPWRKHSVVEALRCRHSVSRETARILAGEIERRALSLNYSAISSELVAELIRNELLAWGLLNETPVGGRAEGTSEDVVGTPRRSEEV